MRIRCSCPLRAWRHSSEVEEICHLHAYLEMFLVNYALHLQVMDISVIR